MHSPLNRYAGHVSERYLCLSKGMCDCQECLTPQTSPWYPNLKSSPKITRVRRKLSHTFPSRVLGSRAGYLRHNVYNRVLPMAKIPTGNFVFQNDSAIAVAKFIWGS